MAVEPATWMCWPTRTAREYPTTASHGPPLEMLIRRSIVLVLRIR
jgi:hypothetical protein